MKQALLLSLLLALAACTQAPVPAPDLPTPLHPLNFGTAQDDGAFALAHHRTGAYVAGFQNADFEGPRTGAGDAFIRRYGAGGALRWARQFGTRRSDTASDAVSDAADHVYVAVNTEGFAAGAEGDDESRVYRYAPNGAASWTRRLGGADAVYTTGLAAHGSNVYAVGYTADYETFNLDAFIQKLGTDGSSGWRKVIATRYLDGAYDVATDGEGNLYVLGTERSQGPTPEGDEPLFVRKYTPGGTALWTRRFSGNAVELALDGAGVYIAGLKLDPNFNYDLRLIKLSTAGARLWDKRFDLGGSEYVTDLSACDGVIVVSGWTNPGLPQPPTTPAASEPVLGSTDDNGTDGFVLKLTPDGGRVWTKMFITRGSDIAAAVLASNFGVFAAGLTDGRLGPDRYGGSDAFLTLLRGDNGRTVWID